MNQFDAKANRSTPDEILEVLLGRLAKGESEVLEQVYESTRTSVYGLAFSYVQQHQDAEDVTHDTYVALYRSVTHYEARGKPMAWIFTIAKNLSLMKLRDRKRQMPMTETQAANLAADNPILTIEDKLVLQAYLQELKQDEQTIVILRAVSGWKHRDIARYMDMPMQHVIVKYNRAIKKLMRNMNETDAENERNGSET